MLSLEYQPLRKREEGSGNIPIPALSQWNVVNIGFTMLWTTTQVVANQNRRTHATIWMTSVIPSLAMIPQSVLPPHGYLID